MYYFRRDIWSCIRCCKWPVLYSAVVGSDAHVLLAQVVCSILFNASEIAILCDSKRLFRRLPSPLLTLLELGLVIFCVVTGSVVIGWDPYSTTLEGGYHPADPWDVYAVITLCTTG
jgi:hypothetical protein